MYFFSQVILEYGFHACLAFREFIFFPISWIVFDIIGNALKFIGISDDVVVEQGLPSMSKSQSVCVFSDRRFIRPDNG